MLPLVRASDLPPATALALPDGLSAPGYAAPQTPPPRLLHSADGLALDDGVGAPLHLDLLSAALRRRLAARRLSSEALARACGVGQGRRPAVLDATAGGGEDGLLLAAFGCPVQLVEGAPEVALLLADALARARAAGTDDDLQAALQRLQLRHARGEDAVTGVAAGSVVYLDPMFPAPGKARRSGRLERLAAVAVPGGADLLSAALRGPAARVVVKRPRRAPTLLADPAPSHSLTGRSVRFDVYARSRPSG